MFNFTSYNKLGPEPIILNKSIYIIKINLQHGLIIHYAVLLRYCSVEQNYYVNQNDTINFDFTNNVYLKTIKI